MYGITSAVYFCRQCKFVVCVGVCTYVYFRLMENEREQSCIAPSPVSFQLLICLSLRTLDKLREVSEWRTNGYWEIRKQIKNGCRRYSVVGNFCGKT